MNGKRKIGRRILMFTLAAALVFPLSVCMPVSSYGAAKFKDVSGHWAENHVLRAYNQNIVNGYPDGRFYPDKSVTRAEFVYMINNAFDLNIDYDATGFKDVTYNTWFYKAVSTAVTAAYASGFSDNTFRPNTPITRQEAAVMLSNILPNYKGKANLKSYRDNRLIATWATEALEKMISRQYIGPYNDGMLHPTDPLTRAQAAKILSDILDNETIVSRKTYVDENGTKLSEKIYAADVIIDSDLGEGSATIDNCVILGRLIVRGGGSNSITINNSRVAGAEVDKNDSAVRIITKGSTVIPRLTASEKSYLQTAGKDGYGILDVTINKYADVTLKGNFPKVSIVGSTAVVALESGKITNLTVTGAGKYSDITLTGKSQVTEATVNAECYFHGEGKIAQMFVNADNITYETKPEKMTVATTVDRAMEEGDSDVDVTFEPRNRATRVDVETKITLTFASSMKLANGKPITDTNVKDFVSLKSESTTSEAIEFTASVNSAKKIITITPKTELNTSTRYYVLLKEEALINAGGTKNEEESIYFTTGSEGGSTSATFRPANGATGVSAGTSITIKFKADVVKQSDGGTVNSAYLQECVQFKSGGAGGSNLAYTATISSSDTITVKPTVSLAAGQTYYVAIAADKLKTKSGGKAIPAASATWTVAAATPTPSAATLNTLTLAPSGGSNVLTGFSGSTTGYDLTVPFGTSTIDVAATAASGTSITIHGTASSSVSGIPLDPSAITRITVSAAASGLTTTTYQLNVEVAGNTDLNVLSVDGNSLLPGTDPFGTNVAAAAASAVISVTAADPDATITINGGSGTGTLTRSVSLNPGNQSITFTVTSNRITRTYTIYITRFAM